MFWSSGLRHVKSEWCAWWQQWKSWSRRHLRLRGKLAQRFRPDCRCGSRQCWHERHFLNATMACILHWCMSINCQALCVCSCVWGLHQNYSRTHLTLVFAQKQRKKVVLEGCGQCVCTWKLDVFAMLLMYQTCLKLVTYIASLIWV